jgi:hypothetical protein
LFVFPSPLEAAARALFSFENAALSDVAHVGEVAGEAAIFLFQFRECAAHCEKDYILAVNA